MGLESIIFIGILFFVLFGLFCLWFTKSIDREQEEAIDALRAAGFDVNLD